jgi:methionyl-tRNA formyltransferase
MGTPGIAVTGLDALIRDGQQIVGVVTSPDKPAGRGRQVRTSEVRQYALEKNLPVHQPENLKAPKFLSQLASLKPDLIIVVAFRMLPEEVWHLPPLGTVNLHASLLPQYRGAAPIQHAIMNGETETGVTTFYIDKEIDTGKVILQERVPIGPDDTAGILHDRIMNAGAELLVRTVKAIHEGSAPSIDQSTLLKKGESLKTAPRIFKEHCRIDWNQSVQKVYDHIRGLSPQPAAWTLLVSPRNEERILKVYASSKLERDTIFPPGTLMTDGRSRFEVVCKDGMIFLTEVQLEAKKKMGIEEFMRGIQDLPAYKVR